MKEIIVLSVVLLSSLQVFGQGLEYSEVVKVDSLLKKDELFSRGRSWFVDYFKDAKEVLQVSDKESGELTGTAMFNYSFNTLRSVTLDISFKINIQIKDGRYKIRVYQFYNTKRFASGYNGSYDGWGEVSFKGNFVNDDLLSLTEKQYQQLLSKCETQAKSIFASINQYLNKPITQEDW